MHPDSPQSLGWLYIDFNSYFASVEQQLNPALRGRPVAVLPVMTDSTCAIAASYEAKAFGIRTGTPVYEAKKMCPGLVCVVGDHAHYRAFHERILDEIDRHIPVDHVCSIDEMACRLMRNEATPERAADIARRIKAGLAENIGAYVRCSIGVAPNKYLAKVATDMNKPDGFTVLMPADIPQCLLPMKLRDLPGIGHNMEARLARSGIRDMKTLLSLSPRHMRAVWGSLWGEKMWYYLRGHDIPDTETKRSSVGHSHVLPPESRPPEHAFAIARRLMLKAAARLRRMEYHARTVVLSVRAEDGMRCALESRCDPVQDSFAFLEILDTLWRAAIAETGRRRLRKVSVTLLALVPDAEVGRQADLFAAPAPEKKQKNRKISEVMDALNMKYGRDTLLLGMTPAQGKTFSGTKIAFTRIPDAEEFLE